MPKKKKNDRAKICPICKELHLKPNGKGRSGNINWRCRKDRKTPTGKWGCGYAETPDRKQPVPRIDRVRKHREKKRKASEDGE